SPNCRRRTPAAVAACPRAAAAWAAWTSDPATQAVVQNAKPRQRCRGFRLRVERKTLSSPPSFRDAPLGAGPESITTIVSMDSGLDAPRRPGMTVQQAIPE